MNRPTGTSPAREIVPMWARGVAVGLFLVAMGCRLVAIILAISLGVGFGFSLVVDWPDHHIVAVWCFLMVLSLALYIRGSHRTLLAAAIGVLVPVVLVWLIAAEDEAGSGVFFCGVVLHALLGAATALSRQAIQLDSSRHWFERRLSEGMCPRCLYNITHLTSPRCPECGFDLDGMVTDE